MNALKGIGSSQTEIQPSGAGHRIFVDCDVVGRSAKIFLPKRVPQIAVTLETPGIDKKDIDIRVTENELEILVDTLNRKYAKSLKLPASVKPTTTKASYKNGVLDLTIQKAVVSDAKKGHRVNVD